MMLAPGKFYVVNGKVGMFMYTSIVLDEAYYYFIDVEAGYRFVACDDDDIKEY